MTKIQLLAFSLHLNLSIKCRFLVSLEKGKFLGLAKKTNLQLPADLRHKTETTPSPLFSIHNPNYNKALIIIEKNISCIPTFSIMNGIKHMWVPHPCHSLQELCTTQTCYSTSFCSLCSFLAFSSWKMLAVKGKNEAETASLMCVNFGGTVLSVIQNSMHKCSLKELIRDLHSVPKCH